MTDTGMNVWREACDASQHHPSPVLGHLAAAAVITAAMAQDKAEIERLRDFNEQLRRYIYDKTPERREWVCQRFARQALGDEA